MRSIFIYLVFIAMAIVITLGVIRLGNRIHAPAVLPRLWQIKAAQISHDCQFFNAVDQGNIDLTLEQSGENFSLTIRQNGEIKLHGKVSSQGFFKMTGELGPHQIEGCLGEILWQGKINPAAIEGFLQVRGDKCPLCQPDVKIVGKPK